MTTGGPALRRVPAAIGAVVCLLALALLVDAHPAVSLSSGSLSSLSDPVSLELTRDALTVAAWGASLVLAAALLVRSLDAVLRGSRRRQPRAASVPSPSRPSLGHARLASGVAQSRFPSPFPLVPRRRAQEVVEPRRALVVALVQECAPAAGIAQQQPPASAPSESSGQLQPSIAVLGPLHVGSRERGARTLRSDTQQLLAYLALHPNGATRDALVATLWPDVDFEKGKKRLWRSISEARGQLGDVVLRENDRYLLDRTAVAIDVDQFESLLRQADRDPSLESVAFLERALLLVRGALLEGSDFPWADGEIRRLTATIVDRLAALGQHQLDAGNALEALSTAEKAIGFDAYNEAANRLAMTAEGTLGLRQAIADRYEQLSRELDSRFGLEPERETRTLYRGLLSQDAPSPDRS
jgi:DNA-binding SARP family transcriptional activator